MEIVPNVAAPAPEPEATGTGHVPPATPNLDPQAISPPAVPPQDAHALQELLVDLLQKQTAPPDPREQRTVQEVVDAYLRDGKDEISARTYEMRLHTLTRFAKSFGTRKVSECRPIDLKRWLAVQTNWPSLYTKQRCRADIQRAMNWSVSAGLLRDNPFQGLRLSEEPKPTGRDMQPEEFQAILRAADLPYRRFLMAMKLSGMRPGEVSALQWKHIDFEKAVAVLVDHKTARKTGKPRVILLAPPLLKLLKIIRRDHHGPAAVELHRILTDAGGQMKTREVVEKMHALGFTARSLYRARQFIGVKYRRRIMVSLFHPKDRPCSRLEWVDPETGERKRKSTKTADAREAEAKRAELQHELNDRLAQEPSKDSDEQGYYVYELPPSDAKPLKESSYLDYVFLNSRGRPWTRSAINLRLYRMRKPLELDPSCKLHSLRHRFISEAIKRNVNLKAVATLAGHSTTAMIERVYSHIDKDLEYLHQAALQAISTPPEPPAVTEDGVPAAGTLPAEVLEQFGESVNRMITRLVELETAEAARKKERERQPPAPPKLNPHQQIAYDAAKWAISQNPELVTDKLVYAWLRERPEYQGQLPPTFLSFRRYLHTARRLIDQCGKRERRRKDWTPPAARPNSSKTKTTVSKNKETQHEP